MKTTDFRNRRQKSVSGVTASNRKRGEGSWRTVGHAEEEGSGCDDEVLVVAAAVVVVTLVCYVVGWLFNLPLGDFVS